MNIQELIDILEKQPDKTIPVGFVPIREGEEPQLLEITSAEIMPAMYREEGKEPVESNFLVFL